jgi:hypothetical protein
MPPSGRSAKVAAIERAITNNNKRPTIRNVTKSQQFETITGNHPQTPKKAAFAKRFTLSQMAMPWSFFVTK